MTRPAYVLARVAVHDPDAYEAYKTAAAESIAAAGGRYLVRGGALSRLEGAPGEVRRLVILEFPDRAAAEAWYAGPAYQAARAHRLGGVADATLELVEGL